jgi:putative Holliday junction resolvase
VTRARAAIGIDWGEKRSGFAVADALRIAVHPIGRCETQGDSADLLRFVERLLAERDVGTLVVGLPLNMDGTEGPQAARTRAFAARLAARFPEQSVVLFDERLSSKEAEERLRGEQLSRAKRRARRDGESAAVVLRAWIDAGERS